MTSVDWTLICVAVLIVGWLLTSSALAWRRIAALKDAGLKEWRARQGTPAVADLDQDAFIEAYVRTHRPRAPFWRVAGLMALAAMTPLIFLAMDVLWPFISGGLRLEGLENGLGRGRLSRMIRFGPDIGAQAATYFMIILAWVAASAMMIRAYHRRRPGRFEDELIRARARRRQAAAANAA